MPSSAKNNFLLLKTLKNTESAQLCRTYIFITAEQNFQFCAQIWLLKLRVITRDQANMSETRPLLSKTTFHHVLQPAARPQTWHVKQHTSVPFRHNDCFFVGFLPVFMKRKESTQIQDAKYYKGGHYGGWVNNPARSFVNSLMNIFQSMYTLTMWATRQLCAGWNLHKENNHGSRRVRKTFLDR